MKILVVSQGKGGTGKTTTATHISWFAAEAGLRVLAGDFDSGNLSKTLAAHQSGLVASQLFSLGEDVGLAAKPSSEPGIDLVAGDPLMENLSYAPLEQLRVNLKAAFVALAPHYDLCVIDTEPGLSIALACALHVADAVISPVEMESYSIDGIKKLLGIILNARQNNPDLKFMGIIPSRVDLRSPRQVSHLAQVKAEYSELLTPFQIGMRSSIAEAQDIGQPVWKSRKTTARAAGAEMRQLGAYVLDQLGLTQQMQGEAK